MSRSIADIPGAAIILIDPDGIYRAGLAACLGALAVVDSVEDCSGALEAWDLAQLDSADLVIVDVEVEHLEAVIERLHGRHGRRVMVSANGWERDEILTAVDAGAVGVLSKQGLTVEALSAQIRAALSGAGVVPPQLLVRLLDAEQSRRPDLRGQRKVPLTAREQDVLRLVADGKPTREVAVAMSYSERTVKTLLRDAVTKLGAQSRSQAIAHAVRLGII